MSQELSHGLVCEIDDRDDIQCELVDDGNGGMKLAIIFISRGENRSGITIGRCQIQNLIDFLEHVKREVRE